MATVNVELSDSTSERLNDMAQALHMPVSDFLEHISQPALDLTEDQLQELDLSIAEADAGEFATEEEVHAVFNRFKA